MVKNLLVRDRGKANYLTNPALFKNALGSGTLPLNLLYKVMGCSVPPLERMFSSKDFEVWGSKIPFFKNNSKASASNTSAHL